MRQERRSKRSWARKGAALVGGNSWSGPCRGVTGSATCPDCGNTVNGQGGKKRLSPGRPPLTPFDAAPRREAGFGSAQRQLARNSGLRFDHPAVAGTELVEIIPRKSAGFSNLIAQKLRRRLYDGPRRTPGRQKENRYTFKKLVGLPWIPSISQSRCAAGSFFAVDLVVSRPSRCGHDSLRVFGILTQTLFLIVRRYRATITRTLLLHSVLVPLNQTYRLHQMLQGWCREREKNSVNRRDLSMDGEAVHDPERKASDGDRCCSTRTRGPTGMF